MTEKDEDTKKKENEKRKEELGFLPQKEVEYNKLLPYAEHLDEESNLLLADIKANLGQAVLLSDLRPGCITWVARLTRYIRLYGRKFSKEDHIYFIHLVYELLIIPDLEPGLVHRFAQVLVILLKKPELISPDELEIDWKPLYKLYDNILNSQYEALGMLLICHSMELSLKSVIRFARPYFSLNATAEILEEFRPLMCPFDVSMNNAVNFLTLFLPTTLPPEKHEYGWKLWLEEFMALWKACHNTSSWEIHLSCLVARLANDNIGYIDWEPYMAFIFTKILRGFQLPVMYKQVSIAKHPSFDLGSAVSWITAVMGGGSSCQEYIDRTFKALDSYFHPSNIGRWQRHIFEFLHHLPAGVVRRLHRERYKKLTWETPVPESHRLSNDDVTAFVKCVTPAALLAMFSKWGAGDAGSALHSLALMRAELVIPSILERLYSALQTLTEPHRLTASLHCAVAVARSLVRETRFYPDGPGHVITLLNMALPGIDPNDFKKSMVTFQFLSTFTTLVPMVDCSKAPEIYPDLSPVMQQVSLETAGLEDFVLQFLDRCFVLIETYSMEERSNQTMGLEENMMEVGLSSTLTAILTQSSPQIFTSAVRKLHSFINGRILETKVAGKFAGNLCHCAAKANPEETLKLFVPRLCRRILDLTSHAGFHTEEILDPELLFSMQILSEVVRGPGGFIVQYRDLIFSALERVLQITSIEGYTIAGTFFRNTLRSLTSISAIEHKSIPEGYHLPIEAHNYLNDWGKPGDIHNLNVKWYVPGDEQIQMAKDLLDKFLVKELDTLNAVCDGTVTLKREEFQKSLLVVQDCIKGTGSLLPMWEEPPIKLIDSQVERRLSDHTAFPRQAKIDLKSGLNVRAEVSKVMHKLTEHMLSTGSDDTKSFFHLVSIFHSILFFHGLAKEEHDVHWKSFRVVKRGMEDRLRGGKSHIRALLVDRAQLQHEHRLLEKTLTNFSETHRVLFLDLLRLATSHYSEVRIKGQAVLNHAMRTFAYSHKILMPELLRLLKNDPSITHEQFKGTLHVLVMNKSKSILVKPEWDTLSELWPTLIQAQHSERPSIAKLLDLISDSIYKNFETFTISYSLSPGCRSAAKKLWESPDAVPLPSCPLPSEEIIESGKKWIEEVNQRNEKHYHLLIKSIVQLMEEGNLHWRHYSMASGSLALLIRKDIVFPVEAVNCFVKNLINDSISVRKTSFYALVCILKQQKRKHKVQEIDPFAMGGNNHHHTNNNHIVPGDRPDNSWMQYDRKNLPRTPQQWAQLKYVHKTHWGFYCWPKKLKVYCPYAEQPPLERSLEELPEEEKPIQNFFSDKENVKKLVKFLSLEEKKGKDKFDGKRFSLFKGLFRNFGSTFLSVFRPHLERLVSDSQESSQRAAAEIIAGLIRGSKHWPFEMVRDMWEWLGPVVRQTLQNVSPETVGDWGTCFATASENRDPNKLHWLLEILMEDPLRDQEGSFNGASRLYVLQAGLAQQEWRVAELSQTLLMYLRKHLDHPYQNVRDRIGSVLTSLFLHDVPFPNTEKSANKSPTRSPFVNEVLPLLQPLLEENSSDISSSKEGESEEYKGAMLLLQTLCKWLIGNSSRSLYAVPKEFFLLLPVLCTMESSDKDPELRQECVHALATLGHSFVLTENLEFAIEALHQVLTCKSWRARSAALCYLQVFVFHNLLTVWKHRERVVALTLDLLNDVRVEVRQTAGSVLSGLLHVGFISSDNIQQLIIKFTKSSRTRLNKQSHLEMGKVVARHAGVLGLCALVNASPYDVPDYLPNVLMHLGDHLHDPEPILSSVKTTLSNFKRTHYDNWQDHKQKFSDDQLGVLTDLLVSPSYYA